MLGQFYSFLREKASKSLQQKTCVRKNLQAHVFIKDVGASSARPQVVALLHDLRAAIGRPYKAGCRCNESNQFQILILLRCGALIAHVPVIAIIAAQGFGLGADKPRMHYLGQHVVGAA